MSSKDELAADHVVLDQLAFSTGGGVAGRIVEVGSACAPSLVGRAVVVPAVRSCGACLPCRRGHALLCRTPFPAPTREPRATVSSRLAVALATEPADLASFAVLGDLALWAYGAVVRASVEPNRAAILVGDSVLGRFVAALVAHRGARAVGSVAALTEHGIEPFGLPVIAVSAGSGQEAIDVCPDGGTVVLCHAAPGSAELAALPSRGISVHGVLGAHPDLLPELVAFAQKGALELGPLAEGVVTRI